MRCRRTHILNKDTKDFVFNELITFHEIGWPILFTLIQYLLKINLSWNLYLEIYNVEENIETCTITELEEKTDVERIEKSINSKISEDEIKHLSIPEDDTKQVVHQSSNYNLEKKNM